MNALVQRAPRTRPGRHAAPVRRRLPRVPRPVRVLGVSVCCTTALMTALRLASTTVG